MTTVTASTLKANTFKVMYDVITTSKSTTWSLVSSFPESSPTFPCIVLNPATGTANIHTFRSEGRNYDLKIEIEFYCKASSRRETIDAEMDKIREGIFSTETSLLKSSKLLLSKTSPIDELEPNTLYLGNNKFYYGMLIVYLRLI